MKRVKSFLLGADEDTRKLEELVEMIAATTVLSDVKRIVSCVALLALVSCADSACTTASPTRSLTVHVTSTVCIVAGGCELLSAPNVKVTVSAGTDVWTSSSNASGNASFRLPITGDVSITADASNWKTPPAVISVTLNSADTSTVISLGTFVGAQLGN
jgi:hypothetical protein